MGLDGITIIYDIENCFDIEINEKDAIQIRTVGDLMDLVWKKIEYSEENLTRKQCDDRIFTVIHESVGVPESKIIRSASFVNDLGID